MKIIKDKITINELKEMSQKMFGNFVKGVVDVENELLAIDGELHADLEKLLIEQGSKSEDLWGINFYPDFTGDEFIEFDSMINLKPALNNRTRGVENPEIRGKIVLIVNKFINNEPST